MASLRIAIGVVWGVFWIGWLISAFTAKRGSAGIPMLGARMMGVRIVMIIVIVGANRLAHHASLTIGSWPLVIAGTGLTLCGLGVAIWARVCMATNWGMPMTLKQEPELVSSGPYQYVRHPIYSGLILAFIGTTLAVSVWVLVPTGLISAYFVWSARTEERILSTAMPSTYPAYMDRTKMLIPFVF